MDKLKKRFEAKIEMVTESGCWIWTGCLAGPQKYGYIGYKGKNMRAHRISYMLYKGPILEGLNILHICDTPSCVNPHHLYAGTQSENIKTAYAKGRKICYFHKFNFNNSGKLKKEDIAAIRSSSEEAKKLASRFKVHPATIRRIILRQIWANVG